jgi:RNA polymerase sigma factor (sigma-70 family)
VNQDGKYSTDEITEAIRGSAAIRNHMLRHLYADEQMHSVVRRAVRDRGGDAQDVDEIFQLAMINLVQSILKNKFDATRSLQNYLYGISKHLWLRNLRKQKPTIDLQSLPEEENADASNPEILLVAQERKTYVMGLLDKLDAKCRRVLKLWAYSFSMSEIAGEMNYKSEGMARKKKHACLQRLIAMNREESKKYHTDANA